MSSIKQFGETLYFVLILQQAKNLVLMRFMTSVIK